MDLRQFSALRAIAELGSFHQAAKRLHVTQSAISHQIKNLEDELGETLVLRSKPRVVLSSAGQRVLRSSERILAEVDNLRRSFAPVAESTIAGELRIASSILGIVYLYGDLIGDFICEHPRVEVKVTTTESGHEGARQVIAHSADVAFTAFPLELRQLQSTTLGTAEHVVIAARTHPLATADTVPLEVLRQHRFVRYQSGAGSRYASDRLFLSSGGYPPLAMESNDTELIKRIVRFGLGLAVVPAFTISADKDRDLRVLRVEGQPMLQEFGLVWRRDIKLKMLDAFCRFCLDRMNTVFLGASVPAALAE